MRGDDVMLLVVHPVVKRQAKSVNNYPDASFIHIFGPLQDCV